MFESIMVVSWGLPVSLLLSLPNHSVLCIIPGTFLGLLQLCVNLLLLSLLCPAAGTLYVFKGQQYWKFDQETLQLQAGYPRSIATDWLDCTIEPLRIMPTSPSLGVKLPPNFRGPQLKIEERVCFCAAFCAISSTLLNVLPLALLTLQGLA